MLTVTQIHTLTYKPLPTVFKRAIVALSVPHEWVRRIRTRRQLITLDGQSDRLLKDVGLQRSDIQRETMKWFWTP